MATSTDTVDAESIAAHLTAQVADLKRYVHNATFDVTDSRIIPLLEDCLDSLDDLETSANSIRSRARQ